MTCEIILPTNNDFMHFKAAMFDFDGTITEPGVPSPAKNMADSLVNLATKMPIAFCTGRQLESFEAHGLEHLIKEINPKRLEKFLENLFLIAENGSVGYFFNTQLDKFEEFYRVKWPDQFIQKQELIPDINKLVKGFGEVYEGPKRVHRVVVVIRTVSDPELNGTQDVSHIYELSDKIYEKVTAYLSDIDEDYEEILHVGNAGIGVLICPANGDKDNGIMEFASYLREKRGLKIDKKASEIMVVGDRPDKSGNDFQFLSGKFGTPFTVGKLGKNASVVKDDDGNRLFHSSGTIYLIKKILSK